MVKHYSSQYRNVGIVLMILAGLIVAGAAAWFIWLKPSSMTTGSQSPQSDQTAVKTPIDKVTSDDATSSPTTTPTELPGVAYVVVDKWGIRVPVLAGMGGFEYSIAGNDVMVARSKELNDISGTCTSNSVSIVRGKADEMVVGDVGMLDVTFKQRYDSTDMSTVTVRSIKAHVGEYYYVVPGSSGASCVTTQSQADQQKELDAEILIVKSLNQMLAK